MLILKYQNAPFVRFNVNQNAFWYILIYIKSDIIINKNNCRKIGRTTITCMICREFILESSLMMPLAQMSAFADETFEAKASSLKHPWPKRPTFSVCG